MKKIISIWTIILLCFSFACFLINISDETSGQMAPPNNYEYTAHAPIRIESNADFNSENGVTRGNGTENNPWVIEGYNISESGLGYSILVGNTTDYFVIRNCNIRDSEGIFLFYLENAIIEFVDIQNTDIGVFAYWANNIVIQNVEISFTQVYDYSIEYTMVNNFILRNVSMSNSPGGGLYLKWSSDALISNCAFQNFIWGHGVHLEDSSRIIVRNNLISNNGWGIYLLFGTGCKIYHNNIIDNTNPGHENALYPSPHYWNDTYPSGGNYWSHYTGVDEYSGPGQNISGSDGIGDTNITWFDQYPLMEEYDITPPSSFVEALSSYWFSLSNNIIAYATDENIITNITLYYSYSSDNATWTSWTAYDTMTTEPWIWAFTFPTGDGYYLFHSKATDVMNNAEAAPLIADAICGFDGTKPIAKAGSNQTVLQNTSVQLNGCESSDNMEIKNYTWNFSYDGSEKILYGNITNFTFDIPGIYVITLKVTNIAGNFNNSDCTITVIDTEKPVADAGQNQNLTVGTRTVFSGYNSTDNGGVVNYSWTFEYNGTTVILYGVSPEFTFWTSGDYTIVLNITDASGNWDADTIVVNVENLPSGIFNYWWIAIIIIIGFIGIYLVIKRKTS